MTERLFETTKTKDEELYCVYCHRNKINGKRYIGQTIHQDNPELRWRSYKSCVHFNNAINKYGWDAFDHYIIQDNLTKEEADELEILNIAFYNTTNNMYGYNVKNGGSHGSCPCSDTHKEKLSKARKGRVWVHKGTTNKMIYPEDLPKYEGFVLGVYTSEETRQKRRNAQLGKKASPEAKKAMSEAQKKRFENGFPEETKQKLKGRTVWNKGMKMSSEFCKKISDAQLGKTLSEEHKKHIGTSQKGKVVSEETKQKMRNAQKKRFSNPEYVNPLKGRQRSEETIQKITETKRNKVKEVH